MTSNCIPDDSAISHAKNCQWACPSSPVNNCTPNYAWILSGNTGMITHYVFISLVIFKSRTYLLLPSLWHIRTRCAIVDNFEFVTKKAIDVAFEMSMLFWLGCFLKSRWRIRGSPQCTVCRQYTTCVWCGRCLSQFQICVCVSGLVSLLSVSKFSLR